MRGAETQAPKTSRNVPLYTLPRWHLWDSGTLTKKRVSLRSVYFRVRSLFYRWGQWKLTRPVLNFAVIKSIVVKRNNQSVFTQPISLKSEAVDKSLTYTMHEMEISSQFNTQELNWKPISQARHKFWYLRIWANYKKMLKHCLWEAPFGYHSRHDTFWCSHFSSQHFVPLTPTAPLFPFLETYRYIEKNNSFFIHCDYYATDKECTLFAITLESPFLLSPNQWYISLTLNF